MYGFFFFFFQKQRCVQILFDHAVSLLHRPKHLKRLISNPSILSQSIVKETQSTSDDDGVMEELKAMNAYVFLTKNNTPIHTFVC